MEELIFNQSKNTNTKFPTIILDRLYNSKTTTKAFYWKVHNNSNYSKDNAFR